MATEPCVEEAIKGNDAPTGQADLGSGQQEEHVAQIFDKETLLPALRETTSAQFDGLG